MRRRYSFSLYFMNTLAIWSHFHLSALVFTLTNWSLHDWKLCNYCTESFNPPKILSRRSVSAIKRFLKDWNSNEYKMNLATNINMVSSIIRVRQAIIWHAHSSAKFHNPALFGRLNFVVVYPRGMFAAQLFESHGINIWAYSVFYIAAGPLCPSRFHHPPPSAWSSAAVSA